MGTNFYNKLDGKHIGKRSAAGMYCWDCGKTLCKGGKEKVHFEDEWFEKCPICGKGVIKESLDQSSAGRELGFNKSKPSIKSGVKTCSSFSWATKPEEILNRKLHWNWKWIENEYGDKFTLKQFKEVLKECPLQYKHSIGKIFS